MQQGWIKLHRGSFDNDLYFQETFTKWQAWVDLLLLANHKERAFAKRGVTVIIPRGSVGYSVKELAKRWKWSQNKVFRFLDFLASQKVSQINIQKSNVTTLITILNYDKYQGGEIPNEYANYVADGSQTETNKNVKNLSLVRIGEKKLKNGDEEINGASDSGDGLYAKRYGNGRPSDHF
jgi:DNA replication protein DnaD